MLVVANLLAQLPKVTGLVVLQHTLLQAALCFLGPREATPPSMSSGLKHAAQQVRSGALCMCLCYCKLLSLDSVESIATV